jgi:cyclic pyranopterin phosphate synthase
MGYARTTLIHEFTLIDGIKDLAFTTNLVLLTEQAAELYQAGVRRINVHLDTLNPDSFYGITRRDELDRVLQGIEA